MQSRGFDRGFAHLQTYGSTASEAGNLKKTNHPICDVMLSQIDFPIRQMFRNHMVHQYWPMDLAHERGKEDFSPMGSSRGASWLAV